ncbi:MAG: hypothetical protein JWP00_892 [Chloroflexi bacterium]|nr:hypothetical protein [Chloroflexota bacterium]
MGRKNRTEQQLQRLCLTAIIFKVQLYYQPVDRLVFLKMIL